jgi:hypothetical protein
MEHEPGQRINDLRVDEIQALDVELAAVSCPFCLTMLGECVTGRDASDTLVLKVIARIIVEALQQSPFCISESWAHRPRPGPFCHEPGVSGAEPVLNPSPFDTRPAW